MIWFLLCIEFCQKDCCGDNNHSGDGTAQNWNREENHWQCYGNFSFTSPWCGRTDGHCSTCARGEQKYCYIVCLMSLSAVHSQLFRFTAWELAGRPEGREIFVKRGHYRKPRNHLPNNREQIFKVWWVTKHFCHETGVGACSGTITRSPSFPILLKPCLQVHHVAVCGCWRQRE